MNTRNMCIVKHSGQWGILKVATSEFIGFTLSKGIKKVWTEKRYAASAFRQHTGISLKDQTEYIVVRL